MIDWKKIIVKPTTAIRETLKILDENALKIVLVADEKNKLLGTVTDGDIRRGILKGISMEEAVEKLMNQKPIVAQKKETKKQLIDLMITKKIQQIPILDQEGKIIGLEIIDELVRPTRYDNWVVLMAGGLGTRLHPMTLQTPKPLLKVGNKPILETIIETFIDQGFYQFLISVNYKAEKVKDYFQNGERWGVQIKYLEEGKKLGTAGALSLINDRPKQSIIVMNGDILTKVDYQALLNFHEENHSDATICVREHYYQMPYGVVKVDHTRLLDIEEKPVFRSLVSGGIYVLNPDVLDYLPRNSYLDMPELFKELLKKDRLITVFPIREYWIDIGRIDDFERANVEYDGVFR